jgi:hypothetical protein
MTKFTSETATAKPRRKCASKSSASQPENGKERHASSSGSVPSNELKMIPAGQIVTLKRNPQYLTPVQMESLKASIQRDGFCAPILVRPLGQNRFEVISGNHRFMAACELGMAEIPCVVCALSDRAARRLAVNLNTIHGQPNPELLAPFLAEFDLSDLADVFLEADMKEELLKWDDTLADLLGKMDVPAAMNHDSPTHYTAVCKCPVCGQSHTRAKP